nr:MAG TPA_asm: hypothetical protein [Caudoviricetes sp.]
MTIKAQNTIMIISTRKTKPESWEFFRVFFVVKGGD